MKADFSETIRGLASTKTTVLRCPNCNKPINSQDVTCPKCGQFLLKITLQPKQRLLWDKVTAIGPDVPTKIGFGGSRGSAKSRAGRDIALLMALTHPNITVFIVCRNLAKAEENYTEKYRIERAPLMKYYKSSPPPEFAFPPELGGSRIAFRYADNLNDIIGLGRGPECYLMIVEQAEAFTERELQELNTPNRWPEAPPGAVKTVYLFNPGGPGTDYLRRVFYSKEYKGTERPGDFFFMQAYGWDNWAWHVNENIVIDGKPLDFDSFYQLDGHLPECKDGKYDDAWLATIPDNHRLKIFVTQTSEGRKMWGKPDAIRIGDLFGDFSKFEGQYFSGVWQPEKIVIKDSLVEDIVKPWWTCLVAGTLVKTQRGDVPIECVTTNDSVWTRKGLRRVVRSWKSGINKDTVKATFSDGKILIGTPDHPVCTDLGFKRLDRISFGDRIVKWNRSISTAQSTRKTEPDITDQSQFHYIGLYGSPRMAQFQRDTISTTRTGTGQTTTYQTLNAFPHLSTSVLERKGSSGQSTTSRPCWKGPKNGGPRQRVKHTCDPALFAWRWWKGSSFVWSAGDVSRLHGPDLTRPHSAPPLVTKDGAGSKDSITWRRPARHAENHTPRTKTITHSHALNDAGRNFASLEGISPNGKCDVYDLAIEGEHEFFANGILVHNCWISSDWGFAHDAATGWAATGKISPKEFRSYFGKDIAAPIDVVVIKRELVVSQTGEGDMADMIAKMTPEAERKMMREYFLSPDAWQKRGSANTISDQIENVMKMRGMPRPEKAADDRAGGWRLLWNCMKQTCSVLSETPSVYPGGFPMLLISDECTGIAAAIPVLIRDPKNREDILKVDNVWDDIGDMVRYLIYSKLKPTNSVPREVRAREVLESAGEHPNAKAMAMRIFNEQEKQRHAVVQRPRWRV